MDPRPFTFGELWGMYEARDRRAWDHTAGLMAMVVGLVDKKARVEKFHPYKIAEARERQRLTSGNFGSIKRLFENGRLVKGRD